jgi:hypothetical protein
VSDKPANVLPYRAGWPLAAGVVAGIALRLVFSGRPGSPFAAMMGSFIYLAPVVVGAVTVYVAERKARRTWAYYFWAPFLANVLFIVGTTVIMIEGLICAVLIVPVFALFGAIGGLIMGAVCRLTKWPKQMLMSLCVLPIAFAPLESRFSLPQQAGIVERSVLVDAKPAEVWERIVNPGGIHADDVRHAWVFRIGVPLPLSGTTEQTADERVRRVTMGKRVYFDEAITDWRWPRYLRWAYRFHEDSFPPQALDDHVRIGGHYFDLIDTSYTLTPVGEVTDLRVSMSYRISTQFNWYADPLARFLLGNLAQVNLEYYAKRSSSK